MLQFEQTCAGAQSALRIADAASLLYVVPVPSAASQCCCTVALVRFLLLRALTVVREPVVHRH